MSPAGQVLTQLLSCVFRVSSIRHRPTFATRRPTQFWGARTFGWGDAIPDELLAKTDEYLLFKELAAAVRAWTAVRRRRLGSEAVQPPPASFLSS